MNSIFCSTDRLHSLSTAFVFLGGGFSVAVPCRLYFHIMKVYWMLRIRMNPSFFTTLQFRGHSESVKKLTIQPSLNVTKLLNFIVDESPQKSLGVRYECFCLGIVAFSRG